MTICPTYGISRAECPCSGCAEYRKTLEEHRRELAQDLEDEQERREAPGRRYTADEVARKNPYNDKQTRGWWE